MDNNKDIIAYADDRDKLIIRNSIKYLHNLTFMESLNVPTVKSLYRTKCRLMELRRHIFLPAQKPHKRCERCFMNFSEGETNVEVQPVKLTKFAKKLLKKVKEKGTAGLTSYQKIYYKTLRRQNVTEATRQNKLVITCTFCKKPHQIPMTKPNPSKPPNQTTQEKKKKKKKKTKDKFCGLDQSVVFVSCTTNNENSAELPNSPGKLNETMSMANIRALEPTSEVTGKRGNKKIQKIKVSRKEAVLAPQPALSTISKAKQRLNQKNMYTLSNMLKSGSKEKPASRLKQFLDSL